MGILSPVMILQSLPFLIFKDLYQGFEIRFHFFKNVLCFMYSGTPKRITENCMYGVYLHVTAGTWKIMVDNWCKRKSESFPVASLVFKSDYTFIINILFVKTSWLYWISELSLPLPWDWIEGEFRIAWFISFCKKSWYHAKMI